MNRSLPAAVAVATLCLGAATAAAHAGVRPNTPSTSGGYVWAYSPSSPSYDATGSYAWSSAGLPVHIDRPATGTYVVTFRGVGRTDGIAQVTPYGATVSDCTVDKWAKVGADEQVKLHCFKPGGTTPVDNMFDLYFSKPKGTANYLAYALANKPTTAKYGPSNQYDNHGGTVKVSRLGVGSYSVHFPHIALAPTSVEVNAYGSGTNRCATEYWSDDGVGGLSVTVSCVTTAGAATDSRFTASVQNEMGVLGDNSAVSAAAWASEPSATGTYTPPLSYQWNLSNFSGGLGPALTSTRTSVGNYTIEIPDLGQITDGGHAQVSIYGDTNGRCQVVDWGPGVGDPEPMDVDVHCTGLSGVATDHAFTVQFTGQQH